MIISAERLLAPCGLIRDGWVEVGQNRIQRWGFHQPGVDADLTVEILSPGFVDVHSHGGGGANFSADPADVTTVLNAHLAHGTTTMVASLVTGSIDTLDEQVRTLASFVAEDKLAGIHLEGPWLSHQYKGAHPENLLINPEIADISRLLDSSNNTIRMVTIAPELPGAMEAIAYLVERDVLAAIGHTGADFETTVAAIEMGARGATHLFNAMPDILHRAPGPALALCKDDRVWVELVCDGVHVHLELISYVMRVAPAGVVLITDAMAAAGCSDGDYVLGEMTVEVRDSVARIAGTTTIAGSTLTLDKAVRTAVKAGVDLGDALKAATSNPADYLGLESVGRIATGAWADLVCLDGDLYPTHVMRRGEWVHPAKKGP